MLPPWLERSQRTALIVTAFLFSAGYASVGLFLLLLTVVAEGVVTKRIPWRQGPLDVALLAFLIVFLISGWLSPYRTIAIGSVGLGALTIFLAFGVLYRVLLRDKDFLGPFLWSWLAGAILASVWAIILHRITGRPAYTPSLGQNAVGTTLLMAPLLGLGIFLTTRGVWRYVAASGIAVSLFGLVLTYTRGAWLGAMFGVVAFFFLTELKHAWRALVLLALIGIIGTALIDPELPSLLQRALSILDVSVNQDRISMFRAAIAVFKDNPVVGTGLNTFALVFRNYRAPNDPNPEIQPFAHNVFLNMAAEGGIFGLLAFAVAIGAPVIVAWMWYVRSRSRDETTIVASLLSAYLGMIAHQMFDGTVISVHLGAGLWFLAAILMAFRPQSRQLRMPV